MTSGFPGGGGPDFYTTGGGFSTGRSSTPMMSINNPQLPYRLASLSSDHPTPPMVYRGADLIGKRSFAELQHHHQQQQQQQRLLHQQQQFQQNLSLGNFFNFRNVKPRINYQQQNSSSLSPAEFSDISSLSPEMSSISNPRYGVPVLHQIRPQNLISNNNYQNLSNGNNFYSASSISVTNSVQNQWTGFNTGHETISDSNSVLQNHRAGFNTGHETISDSNSVYNQRVGSENKMMNQLQELEKALLGDEENDNDDNNNNGSGDGVSVVTNSEWSDIQNLNLMCANNNNQKPISLSPTSSSSSCSSTSASPPITCPKQSITDAATAISEGRTEVAADILTRLFQVSNSRGTFEQRLTAYMAVALRSRMKPSEYPPPVSEIYSKEHVMSTQMLYEVSPCFKLGFMAANRAILEATVLQEPVITLHVIDFDIGQGGQYVHLLHALAAEKKVDNPVGLKITTFSDSFNVGDERLTVVGDRLKVLANKLGVSFYISVNNSKICDLSRENLAVKDEEALVVNLAFKLYKLPDESVTTENLRDELLRRVKGLSPTLVTVVEQEMNANTAPFVARVNENCGYYSVLFESLDATVSMESPERVKIEQGLGRIMNNSVACEGRDRIERCEVFGKWRARMSMAGFEPKPISPLVADSLRSKLNSGTRGNPGFTVDEKSGGICFGWKGRTLILASAWR